jgi:mRNA-degrading endonuclease RelE of RelBE toxin-antitoxin system
MKAAILALGAGRGDIKPLEDEFAGLYRLRIGTHRVVFYYADDGAIICFFAEHRSIVYDVLAATLQDWIARND